jgi:hypothetical protein
MPGLHPQHPGQHDHVYVRRVDLDKLAAAIKHFYNDTAPVNDVLAAADNLINHHHLDLAHDV